MNKSPVKEHNTSVADPGLFMALDDLEIIAHGVVEGALNGLHRSKFIGFSNEFDSHRDYQIGDDLKHINWNLWGKTDKLFIKQYESDTNLNLYIFVDQSASMLAKNAGHTKWAYAARATAALCYLAMKSRDASGVFLLEKQMNHFMLPAVKTGHFQDIVAMLQRSEVQGDFNISDVIEKMAPLCKKKGIVILFSDLFDKEELLFHHLEYFKLMGHEVIVFQILDPIELSLPESGEYEFEDLETGRKIRANAEELRKSYEQALNAWKEKFKRKCQEIDVDWITISTDSPLKQILIEYLNKRLNHL